MQGGGGKQTKAVQAVRREAKWRCCCECVVAVAGQLLQQVLQQVQQQLMEDLTDHLLSGSGLQHICG